MNPYSTIVLVLTTTVAFTSAALGGGNEYTFINIVDDTGPLGAGIEDPVINNNGVIAFWAQLDDATQTRLYTTTGGELTTIAAAGPGQQFTSLGFPSINNLGEVAFRAGNDNIYKNSGGSIVPITAGWPYTSTNEYPTINDAGAVAFSSFYESSWRGVFTGSGGEITTHFIGSDNVFLNLANPDINNAGELAFWASTWAGAFGTYRGSGGTYTTIADSTGPFFNFGDRPTVNESGRVLFAASFDAGGVGMYTGDGGEPDEIADTNSGPYQFSQGGAFTRAINDLGQIAFMANVGLDTGIFTGPDPATDTLIKEGDPLFGSTVVTLQVVRGSINNHGDIAFQYGLANGVRGIAMAQAKRTSMPADLNGDGTINVSDLLILLSAWGDCADPDDCPADLNDDGTVNVSDLLILLSNWS